MKGARARLHTDRSSTFTNISARSITAEVNNFPANQSTSSSLAVASESDNRFDTARIRLFRRAALGLEFEIAARGPIHECYVNKNLMTPSYDQGIGTVIVSRLSSGGMLAVGVYLLDVFCLGVKNFFARLLTREEYHQLLHQHFTRMQIFESSSIFDP
jgi:hypothetical protein